MKFRLLGASALLSGLLLANSTGPVPGVSGAPGEADCSNCHGGLGGPGKLTVALSSGATTYTAGQTVKVKVTLEDPTASRWGFQLTARKTDSTGNPAGNLASSGNLTEVISEGGVQFASHSPVGTFRGTRTTASWEFDWTAPVAGFGGVTFYAAGNAANNNTTETGDRIYKASLALTEATAPGGGTTTPTAKTHSVPQFAFGGGWASTLYFVNSTDAEVSFDANFIKNDGTALDFKGATTQRVTIPAKGLGSIVAANEGGLTQGGVIFDIPEGVTGFSLLKLATENQPDQELVIPIAKTVEQQKTLLVFDDTVINTQLAVANPSGVDATITLTVRDEAGKTVGTSELKLKAGSKAVVLLKDRVADAAGKRGTVEFTTGAGAVSAVAIRFGGTALISTEALN